MVVTGGRNGRRHGDCSRDFLFELLSNEVVGDKDVERGAAIFCKIIIVCFLSVRYRSDGLY